MQGLTAAATLIALFAIGTQAKADDDRAAMAQEQMQQTFERLELTDEQIEQVKPVLEASVASMQEILLSYGMDPESRQGSAEKPGFRKMRAMRKEMHAVRENTLAELELVLSDEQLEEFKRIQGERQAEMRERMRGAR
jgi:hypothetical protein